MNSRHEPYDLDNAVRDNVAYWHGRTAWTRQFIRAADQQASEHPALGMYYLFAVIIDRRKFLRRYIRSCFGYSVKGRIVKPERFPKKIADKSRLLACYAEWATWEIAFEFTYPIVTCAEEASCWDKDTYQKVRESFILTLEQMPSTNYMTLILNRSNSEERVDVKALNKTQIAWLSGWVGSKTSLQRNRRLKYALDEMSDSQPLSSHDRLLRELPATTLIELEDLQRDGERFSQLPRRVARHLEKEGNQSDYLLREGKLETSGCSDVANAEPMLETFLLKEEINAFRTRAHLSAREDQVLELILKGHIDREIACKLGIEEGSIKTLKFRLRQKLKRAAGQ